MDNYLTRQECTGTAQRGQSFHDGRTTELESALEYRTSNCRQACWRSSWVIRLLSVSVVVLIAFAASARPDAPKENVEENSVGNVEASEKATDTRDIRNTPFTISPAFMRVQNSTSTQEQEEAKERKEGAQQNLVDLSNERDPQVTPLTNVRVYRSRQFDEYHWKSDCLLVGKDRPRPLILGEAKGEGLVECGVCRRHDEKKVTAEERPKPKYVGNRRPIDNAWRRHVRQNRDNAWRESEENMWRLDSQANTIWRDGRD